MSNQSIWIKLPIKVDFYGKLTKNVIIEKINIEIQTKNKILDFLAFKLDNCDLYIYKPYPSSIFFVKYNEILMEKDALNEILSIKYSNFWETLMFNFFKDLTSLETEDVLNNIFHYEISNNNMFHYDVSNSGIINTKTLEEILITTKCVIQSAKTVYTNKLERDLNVLFYKEMHNDYVE